MGVFCNTPPPIGGDKFTYSVCLLESVFGEEINICLYVKEEEVLYVCWGVRGRGGLQKTLVKQIKTHRRK